MVYGEHLRLREPEQPPRPGPRHQPPEELTDLVVRAHVAHVGDVSLRHLLDFGFELHGLPPVDLDALSVRISGLVVFPDLAFGLIDPLLHLPDLAPACVSAIPKLRCAHPEGAAKLAGKRRWGSIATLHRDLRYRQLRVVEQLGSRLLRPDPPDEVVQGLTNDRFEHAVEVVRREMRDPGQRIEAEIAGQVLPNVVHHPIDPSHVRLTADLILVQHGGSRSRRASYLELHRAIRFPTLSRKTA